MDDVPGVSVQKSVLRKVPLKRKNAIVSGGKEKNIVSEGRLRLSLTKTIAPRTIMIKVNKEGADGTISDREIRASDGAEYDIATYKLGLPVQTQWVVNLQCCWD